MEKQKLVRPFKCLLGLLFITVLLSGVSAQTKEEYLETVATQYHKIAFDTWEYTKKVKNSEDIALLEPTRKKLIEQTQSAIIQLKGVGAWEGDASLRDAVMRHYETNLKVLQHGYPLLGDLAIYKNKSAFEMNKYLVKEKKLRDDLIATNEPAELAQKKFTRLQKINITAKTKGLAGRMKKANSAYDYYDKIFMMTFESAKHDAELVEVLQKKDIKKIEAVRLKLLKSTKQGLESIARIKPYGNDDRMKMPTKQLLEFYKEEAQELVPSQVEFFKAKEVFEDHVAKMKSKKNRTKQEVDNFNKEMRGLKKKTELYNRENHKVNARRTYVVNVWNNDARNFIELNVPD